MTYIVNDNCIKCKLMDCVEVCPVDCFYEGENTLVIHPDEFAAFVSQNALLMLSIRIQTMAWRNGLK